MIYQVDRIVSDVRVCLDENRASEALIKSGDIDTLTLDEIIRSKITESVDDVHSRAPYYLLEQGHRLPDRVFWGEMESGWVLLPEDFLRLVVFEMSDWEQPVYKVISTDSREYAYQRSRIKAMRGTAQRPVCAIALRPEGRVLEFYSCKSKEATIKKGMYIPRAYVDEEGGVDISELCYNAVIYTIAGLTAMAGMETEKGNQILKQAENKLNI